jgi:hypothetical protein
MEQAPAAERRSPIRARGLRRTPAVKLLEVLPPGGCDGRGIAEELRVQRLEEFEVLAVQQFEFV